jgi:hypothetical protein
MLHSPPSMLLRHLRRAPAAAALPFIEIRNCLSCALSGESLVNNGCTFGESHNLPGEVSGEVEKEWKET